jgi:hypothetical protein
VWREPHGRVYVFACPSAWAVAAPAGTTPAVHADRRLHDLPGWRYGLRSCLHHLSASTRPALSPKSAFGQTSGRRKQVSQTQTNTGHPGTVPSNEWSETTLAARQGQNAVAVKTQQVQATEKSRRELGLTGATKVSFVPKRRSWRNSCHAMRAALINIKPRLRGFRTYTANYPRLIVVYFDISEFIGRSSTR